MFALISIFLGSFSVGHAAEPIFVPDFTPGSSDEFALAVMVQGMVTDHLLQDGHIVLTNDVVAQVVGAEAVTNCAALPTCPSQVLPQLPTQVAVVGRVGRLGGTLVGHVELYEQSNPQPMNVLDVPIVPGSEHLFAAAVSEATQQLLVQIGPSPDVVLMAAARLIAGQPATTAPEPVPVAPPTPVAPPPAPVAPPTPVAPPPAPVAPPTAPAPLVDLDGPSPQPAPPAPTAPAAYATGRTQLYDGSVPHEGPLDPILKDTGIGRRHLVGVEQNFRKSGLDPRDWVYKAMPHAGRLTFEVRAGLGMGDAGRSGELRVERTSGPDSLQQTNSYYQESPASQRQPRGGIYLGYAPAAFVDLGVMAGLQWGTKTTTLGVIDVDANGSVIASNVGKPQDVSAVQFVIQPRVRGYLVPVGPVKPFLFTGADIRFFNEYLIEESVGVQYQPPPGGVVPGWVGGGGMMIDPGPIVGFFAEGSAIMHFGERAGSTEYSMLPWNHTPPSGSVYAGYTITVVGGIQFRL